MHFDSIDFSVDMVSPRARTSARRACSESAAQTGTSKKKAMMLSIMTVQTNAQAKALWGQKIVKRNNFRKG